MSFSIHDAALPLAGGALIGVSASVLLLTHDRVAGISGFLGRVLKKKSDDRVLGLSFLAGLVIAGFLLRAFHPAAFPSAPSSSLLVTALAGVLVGYGTRLGNGCTSGHGVCGNSRLSVRSLVATVTFIGAGAAVVFVSRHLLGGG